MNRSIDIARRAGVLVFMTSLALLCTRCGHSSVKAELDRGSLGDGDLVALLPRGLDAVIDVDVSGLQKLETAQTMLELVPDAALQRLHLVSERPLVELDALAVGLLGMGSGEPEVVFVARALLENVERDRVFAGLQKLGPTTQSEYHGIPLSETATGQAAALLTMRTAVYGNRQTVREVIDNFRGEEFGARKQTDLMKALNRAPRAKEGRPAVLASLLLTQTLRDKLKALDLSEFSVEADYLTVALAVGDGIDIGVVSGYKTLPAAQEAARSLKSRVAALKTRPVLTFLGIDQLVQPFIAVAAPASKNRPTPELHLAYRLAGGDLSTLLERWRKLTGLQKQLGGKS